MATKPPAQKPAPAPEPEPTEAEAPAQPKNKKRLIIIAAAALVLLAVAATVLLLLFQGGGDEEFDEAGLPLAAQEQAAPKLPPEFLALEPIVINLADPGVIRYAQVGITLQIDSKETTAQINAFLPAIRNGALRQISRRTSAELLHHEGKDQLAQDILELVRKETGLVADARGVSPVQAVLFASLIVQ